MKRRVTAQFAPFSLLVVMILTAGCGSRGDKWTEGRPPVYPTSGQVLYKGEPVDGATVTFQPVDAGGKPGSALTDSEGRFEVRTFDEGDGLTAGSQRVAIQKTQMVDKSGKVVELVTDDGMGLTEENVLPKKYADFKTSGIEVKIQEGENELEPFNLSD